MPVFDNPEKVIVIPGVEEASGCGCLVALFFLLAFAGMIMGLIYGEGPIGCRLRLYSCPGYHQL